MSDTQVPLKYPTLGMGRGEQARNFFEKKIKNF